MENFPLAILIVLVKLKFKVFPDKVDLPTPMELIRNGVTAKKSLPKIVSI
ncbi:MAG: hypothetical protein ACI8PB_005254 [Desulforhopalus sp.]|jgi:hypothetical protein